MGKTHHDLEGLSYHIVDQQLEEHASLYLGSSVVEQMTQNPKMKGLNPSTGTERQKERKREREKEREREKMAEKT
jgi:hypothetical protein